MERRNFLRGRIFDVRAIVGTVAAKAVLAGGKDYLRQRKEVVTTFDLDEVSGLVPRARTAISRELQIVRQVDKKAIAKAAGSEAMSGVVGKRIEDLFRGKATSA